MRIGGLEIRAADSMIRLNLPVLPVPRAKSMSIPISGRDGWMPIVREGFAGAWQRNITLTADGVLAHHAVFACTTLIASDVGKLRPKLVSMDSDGIWTETTSAAFSPVLRKPNDFQNHIQFKEAWITSKLIRGNTYVLKERDNANRVRALYILDPSRVTVLVADDGSVFYQLSRDNLSGLGENVTVPASEIIHDRWNCLFHPLVGISPIYACAVAADIGISIEGNSAQFFRSGSNPSGILSAPGAIDKPTAERLSERWNQLYSGDNSGRVAVLGNDLKFTQLRMNAVDSQLIEQLQWTAKTSCAAFHVPAFKAGVGDMPTYQNGETLNEIYYSDCLQYHIESMELALDEGLGIGAGVSVDGKMYGVELDLDGLLRMSPTTQMKVLGDGTTSGLIAPNEGRKKLDMKPVKGGERPFLQQQNYPLDVLASRKLMDPPAPAAPPIPPQPEPPIDAAKMLELTRFIEKRADALKAA